MKKTIVCVSIAVIAGAFAARAQNITWQTPRYISGASDVSTLGTYFGSWSPYIQNAGSGPLTVNGVTFQGNDLQDFTVPSWFTGQYTGFGSPGTANANYNTLLSGAQYGANGDGTYFSFGGLTIGNTYLVQIWAEDTRNIGNRRWENFYADASGYPADGSGAVTYPADGSSPDVGQYVIGTFTANAATEQIDEETWSNVGGQQSGQVNLFQVRDVTTSTTTQPGGVSGEVLADAPLAYYRLEEPGPLVPDIATNSGSQGPADNAANFPGAVHQVPGAIVGDPDTAMRYSAIDTNSDDGGYPTIIPYDAALDTSGSFTVEAWLRPTEEGNGNAQCPLFNCQASTEDYGWDFYQRASVAGSGQQGWEFYMNDENGNRVGDAVGGSYTVGQWCHLVAVYDATAATATLYVNGAQVAQSTGVSGYVPNPSFPMSIGGYSDGSQNPYVGDIDEFAFYVSALSSAQVLTHYKNGTNASRAVSYPSVITGDGASVYLRLDEPMVNVTVNSGTLGSLANGVDSNTGTPVPGPQAPLFPGFEATNLALFFDGSDDYVELVNPPGLNFTGQITLEAWIQPAAAQNSFADIIAHGVNDSNNAEVALRLNGTSSYQVSSWDGNNSYGVTAAIPSQDLGGGNWIYLVGTYDGANWNLFRNGLPIASAPSGTGSLLVNNANWAIGARGRWKYAQGYPLSGLDRQFNGVVDEVAIYSHALTLNRIQTHYAESLQGLTLSRSGGQVTLTWVLGTLVQSTNVAGPYLPVPGASSPYSPPAGATREFYRIKY